MRRILRAGRHLLIFAEGGISDGSRVTVKPNLTGVYDLVRENPDKPVLLVTLTGLEKSLFGKARQPWYRYLPFFGRLPVTIKLKRFDNVALDGGPSGLNKRIESYFNEGIPLSTLNFTG
jgi:1-acyl-sn-glycerol-3-phosphate acyltransferase